MIRTSYGPPIRILRVRKARRGSALHDLKDVLMARTKRIPGMTAHHVQHEAVFKKEMLLLNIFIFPLLYIPRFSLRLLAQYVSKLCNASGIITAMSSRGSNTFNARVMPGAHGLERRRRDGEAIALPTASSRNTNAG